jgi:hypothetical protein
MDEKERQSAFMSALVTEHLVLQTAMSATVSESAARASIYLLTLSSSLVAIGFTTQSSEAFGPFVATVLPAVFVLGLFTIIRLVDVSGEHTQYVTGIARIRGYYRKLTPEAAEYFSAEHGRFPEAEASSTPSLQLGPGIAFLTTTATMVAFINSIVAGAGVTLLARWLIGPQQTVLTVLAGVFTAGILVGAFLTYQRWRFGMFDAIVPRNHQTKA